MPTRSDQQKTAKEILEEAIKQSTEIEKQNNCLGWYLVPLFICILVVLTLCLTVAREIPWSNVCVYVVTILPLFALGIALVKRYSCARHTDYYRFMSHLATILRDVEQKATENQTVKPEKPEENHEPSL